MTLFQGQGLVCGIYFEPVDVFSLNLHGNTIGTSIKADYILLTSFSKSEGDIKMR